MTDNNHIHCDCAPGFLLQPDATAAAQEVFFKLSQNPAAALLFEMIENERERLLWRKAQEALFRQDYRSKCEKEIERRALEAKEAGQRAWRLGLEEEAVRHWQRAENLWRELDRIEEDREIRLAALARVAEKRGSRRKAA